ncbi:radical SAM protein [Kouleothrix sp.]|uniref:radical SAM protein n=1 Tax=Kouleothrix sp. TaxID=2779161 RepID=UPI00391A4293
MRLTELVERTEDGRYRCGVCQWHCELAPGEAGRCRVRAAQPEGIEILNDGMISAANFAPVEDTRLWHFFPGTQVLTLGGWGYAFPADQQRGQYGDVPADEAKRRRLAPERAANVALERLSRGVAWGFSDPSVSLEYVTDLLKSSRAASRYTALVSSGYSTIAALDQFGPYLDGLSLELRAFDDAAYRRLAGIEQWRGILETAAHAARQWGCHIEVTTRLHPQVNDAPEQVQSLGAWISETLGPHTPWHLLPGDAGSAAAAAVARARRLAHELGLLYVYGPEPGQPTRCHECQALLIERGGYSGRPVGLSEGRCAACGADPHMRLSIFKR